MTLIHQYQGFHHTPELWGHTPQKGPFPSLVLNNAPSLTEAQQLAWKNEWSPRLVLGKRAEYFLQYTLRQQPHFKLLNHSQQIITEEKQTLGELDFLYQNTNTQQVYHLEQCFKFYCYLPDYKGMDQDRWWGPNLRDSLTQKLTKLKERQFPLLHHPVAQVALAQLGVDPNNTAQQISYKASLFLPYGTDFPADSTLNPACFRGHWLFWEDFLRHAPNKAQYCLPNKCNWANNPATGEAWLNREAVLTALEGWLARERAPLCWVRLPNGTFLRWFIVGWNTNYLESI